MLQRELTRREVIIKRFLENGMFITRDCLEAFCEVSRNFYGKTVNLEILGETLKDGTKTSRPDKVIGVRLCVETLSRYDKFWALVRKKEALGRERL